MCQYRKDGATYELVLPDSEATEASSTGELHRRQGLILLQKSQNRRVFRSDDSTTTRPAQRCFGLLVACENPVPGARVRRDSPYNLEPMFGAMLLFKPAF